MIMTVTATCFKWVDLLESQFDKSWIDLDSLLLQHHTCGPSSYTAQQDFDRTPYRPRSSAGYTLAGARQQER